MTEYLGRDFKELEPPTPANATSEKNKGLIIINVDEVEKSSNKRNDLSNIRDYHKLMIFEELCHLVEQKGEINYYPPIVNNFFIDYSDYLKTLGKTPDVGLEVIQKLRGHRSHYEVYRMIAQACPELFFKRWSKVFWDEGNYVKKYSKWKILFNKKIALARLLTDYIYRVVLYLIIGDYAKYGIKKDSINETLEKCKRALVELDEIIEEEKPELLEKLNKIDEFVLLTQTSFFKFIYALWKESELLT